MLLQNNTLVDLQVKVIQSSSYYSDRDASKDFEEEINQWLEDNAHITLYKIESDTMAHFIITRIWYYS